MRLHKESSESFISPLAEAMKKDPLSLENWQFMHIKSRKYLPAEWTESLLNQMIDIHKEMDCDIVHCPDNDVLFIGHNMQPAQLYEIADEFTNALSAKEENEQEIMLYDMLNDAGTVKEILNTKNVEPALPTAKPTIHNFGEVASFKDVFEETKKLRKGRQPLHVMIVEDDALTRRIVTGTFKEDYALITAATAEEAVANYLLHAPDIVFLDIGLPDASGFDVLHQIIASDSDAYVVMFSSNNYLNNVVNALSNGASGFVSKPFKKEKMRGYIQTSAQHHNKCQI